MKVSLHSLLKPAELRCFHNGDPKKKGTLWVNFFFNFSFELLFFVSFIPPIVIRKNPEKVDAITLLNSMSSMVLKQIVKNGTFLSLSASFNQ